MEVHDVWRSWRELCKISDEDERWLNYADRAIETIDADDIWQGIVEGCKILKYPEPSAGYRCYFDSLFNFGWFMWSKMYLETERTASINHLIDHLTCVCKLKY